LSAFVHAADLKKALAEADSRRKAAENGLRQIKAKSSEQAEQVRASYTAAASGNNAWVDAMCQSIEQDSAKGPDVGTAAQVAANSLVDWVSLRNRALGIAELTGGVADGLKKSIAQNLVDIASESWKANHGGNQQKRTAAAVALKERLRWLTWEEVR
jgi:hypothetical protein